MTSSGVRPAASRLVAQIGMYPPLIRMTKAVEQDPDEGHDEARVQPVGPQRDQQEPEAKRQQRRAQVLDQRGLEVEKGLSPEPDDDRGDQQQRPAQLDVAEVVEAPAGPKAEEQPQQDTGDQHVFMMLECHGSGSPTADGARVFILSTGRECAHARLPLGMPAPKATECSPDKPAVSHPDPPEVLDPGIAARKAFIDAHGMDQRGARQPDAGQADQDRASRRRSDGSERRPADLRRGPTRFRLGPGDGRPGPGGFGSSIRPRPTGNTMLRSTSQRRRTELPEFPRVYETVATDASRTSERARTARDRDAAASQRDRTADERDERGLARDKEAGDRA